MKKNPMAFASNTDTASMTSTSSLAALQAINATSKFNAWLGIEVLSASEEGVAIQILWREELGQYAGYLHAGVIGALIDTVCGFAASVQVGRVLASHFSVNCLRPAVGARFVAEACVVKPGRRQAFASAQLLAFDDANHQSGTLVATGQAIFVPLDTRAA